MSTLFKHNLDPDPECHVAAVRLFNYKAAGDVRLQLGRRLHAFVGDNGAGKTTILDGIAAGLAGVAAWKIGSVASGATRVELDRGRLRRVNGASAPHGAVVLRLGAGTCVVEQEVYDETVPVFATAPFQPPELVDEQANLWFGERWNAARRGVSVTLPVIAYYTAERAAAPKASSKRGDGHSERTAALRGAFSVDTSYDDLVSWFAHMERAELYEMRRRNDTAFRDPHLEAVRETVRRIVPAVSNLAFNPVSSKLQAEVETASGVDRFALDELSGGGRVMLAMAADLARRMIQANPHLGLESPAIVLIDELDLHLHPTWQASVIDDLMGAFPNAQFIVSTHSEQIIGAVPSELVRSVRCGDNGIVTEPIGDFHGATYDRILVHVMRREAGRNAAHQVLLQKYWELIDGGDGEGAEAAELRKILDEVFPPTEPELVRADVAIRRKRALGGRPG